ncbi:hypothetical protein [Actinopolyspora mortivallis]|nr:hypothetical protein [Actinopolyspora mortivallis]
MIASVAGTVLMVVLTVVLATWFPAEPALPAGHENAAVPRMVTN